MKQAAYVPDNRRRTIHPQSPRRRPGSNQNSSSKCDHRIAFQPDHRTSRRRSDPSSGKPCTPALRSTPWPTDTSASAPQSGKQNRCSRVRFPQSTCHTPAGSSYCRTRLHQSRRRRFGSNPIGSSKDRRCIAGRIARRSARPSQEEQRGMPGKRCILVSDASMKQIGACITNHVNGGRGGGRSQLVRSRRTRAHGGYSWSVRKALAVAPLASSPAPSRIGVVAIVLTPPPLRAASLIRAAHPKLGTAAGRVSHSNGSAGNVDRSAGRGGDDGIGRKR